MARTFTLALLALGAAGCAWHGRAVTPAMPRGFVVARPVAPMFDPELAHTLLDTRQRDRWQQPARIVRELRLRRGATVADIGTGSGYLLPYLSRAVGPAGTVFAEEVQEAFLPALRRRAEKLHNVKVVLGAVEDPRLPSRDVGTFVLLTVYHEVDRPVAFLQAMRRYAAPTARLAIVDFDAHRNGAPAGLNGHQVAEGDVLKEAGAAGWQLAERHDFSPGQFFLVFRKAAD